MPLVTVLMPVYNAARFLRPSLQSILSQTVQDFEVIIIDDASTDGTPDIVSSYDDSRIRLYRRPENGGVTTVLNQGLSLASGEMIARQDADDISHPRRLERQIHYLTAHPDTLLVGSQARLIDEAGQYVAPVERSQHPEAIRWYQMFDNPFIHSSVLFRRALVGEFGGYDPSFQQCEDYELWSRVALERPVANLAEQLLDFRLHAGSKTRTTTPSRAADENRRIGRRNVRALLGETALAETDVDLLVSFREGLPHHQLASFLGVLERALDRYLRLYPAAGRVEDFWRTLARQYLTVGYRLATGLRAGNPTQRKSLLWPVAPSLLRSASTRPRLARALARELPRRLLTYRRVLAG